MKLFKNVLLLLAVLAIIGISFYAGKNFTLTKKIEEENITVVLEKVKKVFKLTTVEGYVSEIYDYKDYYTFDFSFLRKKALVRVNGKVLAGFDFEDLEYRLDEQAKTLTLLNFPKAEILAIDHELDYYDISQGTFNTFTTEDYNRINERAKAFVSKKAIENQLLDQAEEQKEDLLAMLEIMVRGMGWKLLVESPEFRD